MGWLLIILGVLVVLVVVSIWLRQYKQDNASPGEKADLLLNTKHSTKQNRFAATGEMRAAKARADALTEINREAFQLGIIEDSRKEAQVKDAERQYAINELHNKNNLLL